jgi:hypothetical protein
VAAKETAQIVRLFPKGKRMPPTIQTPPTPVDEMTERELLEEIVEKMRYVGAVLQQLSENPMLANMFGIRL